MGTPGMFPPLAGSEWVTAEGHERIIRIVLNGLSGPIEVAGAQFNNVMVPWRDTLKDEDIASVLSYIRSEWGNKADPVTVEEVKKVREGTKDRGNPWTADELKQVPEKAQ
jgi:mono/diheme cytochrome c family protein